MSFHLLFLYCFFFYLKQDNKRTVVSIKRKDITTVDNDDTLKDWKSLIRRKKDDMKRVLISKCFSTIR